MEESRKIKLLLGGVSLKSELGSYYIDMRPAIIHYQNNIWGGKYDDDGVPMISVNDSFEYFPINISQYGFILHADWLTNKKPVTMDKLTKCLDKLEQLKDENDIQCVWWHKFHNEKYNLKPPWASAMAQGECISFYLRMYQILGDEKLLKTALKAYRFMRDDMSKTGVRRRDSQGNLWFEEYPSDPPSFVLNGFIYAIFGLYDLYRITRNKEVKEDVDDCITTLKENISKFDCGYWSLYDLQKKELVRYYYQKNVHVPQLEVLYKLTEEKIFKTYKEKWERQVTRSNFMFVQAMYRVRPRIQKMLNFIGITE